MGSANNWDWYRQEMQTMAERDEEQLLPILSFVEKCDSLVGEVFEHIGICGISERPQDYVASILISRAYRLAISAIFLTVSGYLECQPNLNRTIFEINMRLFDLKFNPIPAAYGYLLNGVDEQVQIIEDELKHRKMEDHDLGDIEERLNDRKNYYKLLSSLAQKNDCDLDIVLNKHGRLNIKHMCKKIGIEKAYDVDYALMCCHVHERDIATGSITNEFEDRIAFVAGPIKNEVEKTKQMTIDVIKNLALAIAVATEVTQDEKSLKKAEKLIKEILPYCEI